MKKTLHLLTTALLLTASHAWADSYKGTLERHGLKMEYTLSGGIVTDKDDHRIGGAPVAIMGVSIEGEVEAGASFSASCRKLATARQAKKGNILGKIKDTALKLTGRTDKNKDMKITVLIRKAGETDYIQATKEDNGSVGTTLTVPAEAEQMTIILSCQGPRDRLECHSTWNVVKRTTAPQPSDAGNKQAAVSSGKKYTDRITHNGHTMKYTISGPEIKLKDKAELVTNSVTDYHQVIRGIVKPGQTVSVDMLKESGSSTPRLNISFEYLKRGAVPRFSNAARMIQTKVTDQTSKSYTVPSDAEVVYAHLYYQIPAQGIESTINLTANLYVEDKIPDYAISSNSTAVASTTASSPSPKANTASRATPTKTFKWDEVAEDECCPKCQQPYSFYEVQEAIGTVQQKCIQENDNRYAKLTPFDAIYCDNCIRTSRHSQVWLNYDDAEECIIIRQNTTARIERMRNGKERWHLHKGHLIANYHSGSNVPSFQLANCVIFPKGSIVIGMEEDGRSSRATILSGSAEVLSTVGGQKQTLKPGHMITVTTDGVQEIKPCDTSQLSQEVNRPAYDRKNTYLNE